MQEVHGRGACTRGYAHVGGAASRRRDPGEVSKYLHTHVRAECTATGASNRYRMVVSIRRVDVKRLARGRTMTRFARTRCLGFVLAEPQRWQRRGGAAPGCLHYVRLLLFQLQSFALRWSCHCFFFSACPSRVLLVCGRPPLTPRCRPDVVWCATEESGRVEADSLRSLSPCRFDCMCCSLSSPRCRVGALPPARRCSLASSRPAPYRARHGSPAGRARFADQEPGGPVACSP